MYVLKKCTSFHKNQYFKTLKNPHDRKKGKYFSRKLAFPKVPKRWRGGSVSGLASGALFRFSRISSFQRITRDESKPVYRNAALPVNSKFTKFRNCNARGKGTREVSSVRTRLFSRSSFSPSGKKEKE